MKNPEITSFTRLCAPNPTANPRTPAPARSPVTQFQMQIRTAIIAAK